MKSSLFFLFLFFISLKVSISLKITSIPDGVIVETSESARQQSASVNFYILLETRIYEAVRVHISDALQALELAIRQLEGSVNETSRVYDPMVFGLMRKRISMVRRKSHFTSLRSKRGLFNFAGGLAKTLFGTATEDDVAAVRTGLDQLTDRVEVLYAEHNKLVGLTNEIGQAVIGIGQRLDVIRATTELLWNRLLQVTASVKALARIAQVEAMLSLVESVAVEIVEREQQQRNYMQLCQAGVVTEDLLPRPLLNKLSTFTEHGLALENDWYYHHLTVNKYFVQNERFVCRIDIPLVYPEPFLYRPIHTYPTRKGEMLLRIFHDVTAVVGTISGKLFYANQCVGREPKVCHAGMVFPKGQEECVRGMISNDSKLKAKCSLHASKFQDFTNILLEPCVSRHFAWMIRPLNYYLSYLIF